jgi:2,4-dienoyl-CoA reductase-like NADH-dependent reductase (Old Yellow Enzyme family)/thioredoxin reductase
MSVFPNLFQAGQIGNLTIPNRVVKAPQSTGLSNMDGSVSERLIRHYKRLAEGGAGMIIVEYAFVDNEASKSAHNQLGISSNEHISGLAWLASTIKEAGAVAGIQIEHCGRQKFLGTKPMLAPSRLPWPTLYERTGIVPDEITLEQIKQVVESFGDAALRAKQAGFELVEIHGAHGYLITNFLSTHTNKRNDLYGGTLENRMRFLVEIVQNIKAKVGEDFPVTVRLSGTDYQPDGLNIEETIQIAKKMEQLGLCAIHVSGGDHPQMIHQVTPMLLDVCHNTWAAEAIKKEVNIPVIASGSITLPVYAEEIIKSGKGDFVGLGRPLWADPDWANKAKEGRPEEIKPCIRCNDGCLERTFYNFRAISCTVNPGAGREGELEIAAANVKKRVAIIGGGPSGMEAARVSALRGHEVTLFEKRELGGALIEAGTPEFKSDLIPLRQYYVNQMEVLGINVVQEEATIEKIKSLDFDTVIVAVGGKRIEVKIPGINNPSVLHALDVVYEGKETGDEVVVIGGGLVGVEAALHLVREKNKKVTIVEMGDSIMRDVGHSEGIVYQQMIQESNLTILTSEKLEEIFDGGVVTSNKRGKRKEIKADNVILAMGITPNTSIEQQLRAETNLEVHLIGDAKKPAKFYDAIHAGFHTALKIGAVLDASKINETTLVNTK